MKSGARIQAAIDIFANIETMRRPAPDALREWGLAHRFAGSRDRAAIASLVYDALRRRASAAWRMNADTPRAIVLATLHAVPDEITTSFADDPHAPAALTDDEIKGLSSGSLENAPAHVRGDYPEWLHPSFARAFGDEAADEGAALATRAALDLRVNTLKADRAKVAAALAALHPTETPHSPLGLRIAAGETGRTPHVQSEPGFLKGWFEIQDEGSQLAALLAGAAPGRQVADICAGGGGKTLALASLMGNKGQIYASDSDKRRLAPIYERLQRADVRNAQIRSPGRDDPLADLVGRLDLVVCDAPCTGTGTWRRNPDAKWRVRPGALAERRREQNEILEKAAPLVKVGGRIAYITCSVLPEENEDQVEAFLQAHPEFAPVDGLSAWRNAVPGEPPERITRGSFIQLTPRRARTDAFFVALLERRA